MHTLYNVLIKINHAKKLLNSLTTANKGASGEYYELAQFLCYAVG